MADEEVLDAVQIQSLRELDGPGYDTLRELSGMFATSSAAALPAMRSALLAGDLNTVRTTAHSLKGSSASLGAVLVAKLSSSIELAANAGKRDDLARLFDELAVHIARTNIALSEAAQTQ